MSDDWDVDSYKTEYENEEHWELRRNFMLAHKDKFSEDELVCLAQVFTNIEFLGCRYPEKTMIRVAELAKGVVESFREKRKDSLKRTFVAASDAASAKVKGQAAKEEHDPRKKIKTQTEEKKSTNDIKSSVEKDQKNDETSKRSKYGGVKTFEIEQNEQVEVQAVIDPKSQKANETKDEGDSDPLVAGGKEEFVLVLSDEDENPISLIEMNASLNKCPLRWQIGGKLKICKLFINGQCLGTGSGRSVIINKQEAAKVAIAKLRESYYGIKMKSKSPEMITVHPSELGTSSETTPESLGEDNVGRKLMKLMGWQGGGLGSKEQGRKQPVAVPSQARRDGLGLKKDSLNAKEFKKHARKYIETWAKSDSEKKLVFSTDFTSAERKIMHQIAKSFSLRSKSYGKEDNRHLVISRRINPQKILQELLKDGGHSDKYELLIPTKC